MKKIAIDKVMDAIDNPKTYIELSDEVIKKASKPLTKMLELAG